MKKTFWIIWGIFLIALIVHYLYVIQVGEKYDIIDKFYTRLEKQIEENPVCWLWSHRRWKYEGEYQKVLEKKDKVK